MADHSGPNDAAPADQNDLNIKSEDELAAKLEEGGFAGEQRQSLFLTAALAFGLTTHALEVRDSVNLLKKPLDLDKLFTDPQYKSRVERAIELTNRYGRFVKKGDLAKNIPKVQEALKRVQSANEQIFNTQANFSHNNDAQLKNIYGLNDDQFKSVRERALAKFKENPGGLTMTELLRNEARNEILHTTEESVKKDPNVKRNKRNEEIKKRLDTKDGQFNQHKYTESILKNEKDLTGRTIAKEKLSAAQTLGINLKPEQTEILNQPFEKVYIPPQDSAKPAIPSQTPSVTPSAPPVSIHPSVSLSIPNIGKGGFTGGLKSLFSNISGGFKSLTSSLKIGAGGLLKGGLKWLGKSALVKGLGGALTGGVATALSFASDIIKALTGIDIEGMIFKMALFAVLAVVAIVLIPLLLMMGIQNPAAPPAGQSVQLQ